MSINLNSHFASVPTLEHPRSTYDMSCNVKTSFNVGDVIPFFFTEVLPGDTWKLDTNKVLRMPPMVSAPMDNLYLDTYYFFVPNRILWEHWRDFLGENRQSAWIPTTEYEIPQIKSPVSTGWTRGTIADYLGIPVGISNLSVNALPFRAYAMIIDEWFRSQNLQDPLNIPKTDATVQGTNGIDYVTDVAKGGKPFKANKFFDLFTSCLPDPQKGPDVTIGISEDVPVYAANNKSISDYGITDSIGSLRMMANSGSGLSPVTSSEFPLNQIRYLGLDNNTDEYLDVVGTQDVGGNATNSELSPSNLFADTSAVSMVTINALRQAFQIQRFYEKNARSGSRYRELLKAHFGVNLEDSRAMIPEYLGGNRIPININQIASTFSNSTSNPLGDVGGLSITNDSHFDFQKSFTEHGILMGVCVARYKHTYSQGLNKIWSKKDKFDYFWPTLANLGETAVLNKEIYYSGISTDDEVFGYNEMWYEYRYLPDMCTGCMRPTKDGQDLSSWHFGDYYKQTPALSSSWLQEDPTNVDRVLALSALNEQNATNQLFADILVSSVTTRVVPTYSVPGLIDHN